MAEEQHIQEEAERNPQPERVRNDWKDIVDKFSYKGIVSNIPFLAFIVLLCVLYISNDQRTIQTQRVLNEKHEELKELRWKYMDIKSQLMGAGMEPVVIRSAANIGLKPLMLPAYKISKDSVTVAKK